MSRSRSDHGVMSRSSITHMIPRAQPYSECSGEYLRVLQSLTWSTLVSVSECFNVSECSGEYLRVPRSLTRSAPVSAAECSGQYRGSVNLSSLGSHDSDNRI